MALSGKYDFQGIKKQGGAALRIALASSPYTAWLNRFGSLTKLMTEFISNWLANKGLVLLNVHVMIPITGYVDQKAFDKAFESALSEIQLAGGADKMTPAQQKVVDDGIIEAFRKFAHISTRPNP